MRSSFLFGEREKSNMDAVFVERLTDELKSLVGWGATPERLIFKPTLCRMAGVTDDMSLTMAGGVCRRYIEESINSLNGVHEFEGKKLDSAKLNRAYKLLLWFEGSRNAVNRRRRVIFLLDLHVAGDQWRRTFGMERRFLAILAEHMVAGKQETFSKGPTCQNDKRLTA